MKIGFLGYGNMGSALGEGWIKDSLDVYYYDKCQKDVKAQYLKVDELIKTCEIIILAVKPYQYEEVLEDNDFQNKIVVSIAPGITGEFMKRYVNKYLITMPNTPALVNQGITAIVPNSTISTKELEQIKNTFGETYEIEEEQLVDAIALTGSSPAYFFYYVEKIAKTFNQDLFTSRETELYLAKVMKGCAEMIIHSNEGALKLTENVCSPNGTTIQAVNTFDENKMEDIIFEAVNNCKQRAKQMQKK